jgi:hypothetical protein
MLILVHSIFSNTKDKILKDKKSDVVYKIECSVPDCHKVYIGETTQHLEERM